MSTEHHNQAGGNGRPQHADVSFEAQDVRPSPILHFLAWMGVVIILSFVFSLGFYKALKSYWVNSYAAPSPMHPKNPEYPPEPRLQETPGHLTDPQQDSRDKVRADNEENNKLGWIDQQAGIAQIPVKDAMQLIVDKGLPAVKPEAEKK